MVSKQKGFPIWLHTWWHVIMRAIHANVPDITLADVDCRKMPGCSTSWVMLFASAGTAAGSNDDDVVELDSDIVMLVGSWTIMMVKYEKDRFESLAQLRFLLLLLLLLSVHSCRMKQYMTMWRWWWCDAMWCAQLMRLHNLRYLCSSLCLLLKKKLSTWLLVWLVVDWLIVRLYSTRDTAKACWLVSMISLV